MDERTRDTEYVARTTPGRGWLAVALVLLIGGALRYAGIRWGLPNELHLFSYHPDEFHSLRGAFALSTGDLNPHFFNYGSLYLYLVAFSCLLLAGGHLSLVSVHQFPGMLQDWTLVGREVSVLAALLTVVTVYWIGRQIAGHRQGLVAALLCAVFPIHVLHSHYGTVDVTLGLFTALALLFAIRIYQHPSSLNYCLAGLAVGLAASTKYAGVIVVVAPLTAHLLRLCRQRAEPTRSRNLLWLLVLSAGAFAASSPYTLMDWQHARQDILYEMQHMRVGEEPARSADPNGYWFHLQSLTVTTTGATILAILGIWGLLREERYRGPGLVLAVFTVVWLAVIGASGVRYMRYEMPLVPAIAVLAAASPLLVWRKRAELKLVAVLLVAAAMGASSYYSTQLALELMQPDERDRMLWMVTDYVPQQETVGTVWEPWFQGLPLDYANGGALLRESPLWQSFFRPVRPHVTIGIDAKALERLSPYAVTYTNFEMRDALRVGQDDAREFVAALESRYDRIWDNRTRAPLAGCCGWVPPQDWLYPFPAITFWVTKEGVEKRPGGAEAIIER